MTLSEIYAILPLTEKTLWKRMKGYTGFQLINDLGEASLFRVISEGREIGIIKYYRGRKLVAHGKQRTDFDGEHYWVADVAR